MAEYSELPTLIGKIKRAAIDCYMLQQRENAPYSINGDRYTYDGGETKRHVTRPGTDGEGGGDVSVEGWFDWGTGGEQDALMAAFDDIRGQVDDIFTNLKDVPDGVQLFREKIQMMDAAEKLTPGGADATPKPGGGSNLDLNNVELSARVNNIYGLSYRLSSLTINAFREAYADRLAGILDGQAALAATLGMAAAGQEAVFLQLQQSTADFAFNAAESLNELAARLGNGAGGSPVPFIIGGAIASVASLLTGGTAAVALGTIGVVGGTIGDLWPDAPEKKTVEFSGSTLSEMMDNIRERKTEMVRTTVDDEQVLQDALTNAAGAVDNSRATFDIAAPDYPGSGPGQEGLNGPGTIVQDTSDMQQMAGSCQIVADFVNEARSMVIEANQGASEWSRPSGIGITDTGPYQAFDTLTGLLSGILGNTRTEMSQAATKLIDASLDFQATDAEVQQTLDREKKEIEDAAGG